MIKTLFLLWTFWKKWSLGPTFTKVTSISSTPSGSLVADPFMAMGPRNQPKPWELVEKVLSCRELFENKTGATGDLKVVGKEKLPTGLPRLHWHDYVTVGQQCATSTRPRVRACTRPLSRLWTIAVAAKEAAKPTQPTLPLLLVIAAVSWLSGYVWCEKDLNLNSPKQTGAWRLVKASSGIMKFSLR